MPDLYPTIDAIGKVVTNSGLYINLIANGVTASSMVTTSEKTGFLMQAIDLSSINVGEADRYFVEFDTSGITVKPASATFKMYGYGSATSADVICVKADDGFATAGALVVGDWDTWNEASPTDYTDELTTWDNNAYNTFTLTDTALTDMGTLDEFQMICIEKDHDHDQTAEAGHSSAVGAYMRSASGGHAQYRPVLSYVAVAVPSHKFDIKSGKVTINSGKLTIK